MTRTLIARCRGGQQRHWSHGWPKTRLVGVTAAVALLSATPSAQAQSSDPLVRDNFPIGSSEGTLCQVQAVLQDPAINSIFDRAWLILCRDAAQPVGRIFALRGVNAPGRVAARPGAPDCTGPAIGLAIGPATAAATTAVSARASAPVSAADFADCRSIAGTPAMRRRVEQAGNTSFVAEGLTAYDDALRIALASVMAGRIVPGTITVATTSIDSGAAMARVQVASLAADRALAEGYRRNNSGDYAEAAVYFEALERRDPGDRQGVDPSEFTLNRALQLSNLGDFNDADRLFAEVDATPTADIVQLRLRRNFHAMHALNQGDLDAALATLDQPLAPLPMTGTDATGALVIDPVVASAINNGSASAVVRQINGDDRLTPQERATLIDAQADQLRGTTLRIAGQLDPARAALTQSISRGLAVRNGRVTTIIRLRAQTMGEIALVDERAGQLRAADAGLSAAITLLETEYPETLALAAARAKYGAFLLRQGDDARGLTVYRQVISAISAQHRQLTGLTNQMAPYFGLLADRSASDPSAITEYFAASQLLIRPGVADTQAVLSRELSGGDSEASGLFRQANNLSRDIERARIDFARQANGPQSATVATQLGELTTRIANLSAQQTATLVRLADYPQYRAVSADTLTIADLAAALAPDEAYAKLTIVGDDVYGLLVTRSGAQLWRASVSSDALSEAVDTLRASISVYEGGQYQTYPFDAERAQTLYTQLFGPAASALTGVRHLIFEPDGAMLRLPLNLLITDAASVAAYRARAAAAGGDPFDMRGVAWLGRRSRISTAVSALAFRNARQAPASTAQRAYLGLGHNAPPPAGVAALRLTANGTADDCAWNLNQWSRPISADELTAARDRLMPGGADVVTGAAFTDRALLGRTDLNSYRILHFATHGLVTAPRPECPARPALLTSFDTGGLAGGAAGASDGLLSFEEIFDLQLNADLVILSACDTAGAASVAATVGAGLTSGGGSALDGLVRAFIGAGGRSVIASHWPAPDAFNATQRLIGGLFTASPGVSIADALGRAQDQLMDEAQTSHPYYWAGFAIIGDGARPVVSDSARPVVGAAPPMPAAVTAAAAAPGAEGH